MIVGITGTNASGKGTIAAHLAKNGFASYSLSDELRSLLKKRKVPATRENLIKWGRYYRARYARGYLAASIKKKFGNKKNVVVDSIRNLGEISELKKTGRFVLVGVDAPVKIRFERAKKRSTHRDQKTFAEFIAREKEELNGAGAAQQIRTCMKKADIRIDTKGGYEKLYKKLDALLPKLKDDS